MPVKKIAKNVRDNVDKVASNSRTKSALKIISNKPGDYFVKPEPPYYSQFASPTMVSDILDKKIKSTDDEKWSSFGFEEATDYDFWSWRLCGLICVKMILDAHKKAPSETIALLTEKAVGLGGYDIEKDVGWFSAPLVELAKSYGLKGKVFRHISATEIAKLILDNKFFIASVNPSVIRQDIDSVKDDEKRGHLVLVWGVKIKNGDVVGFYIHNPSGRKPTTQEKAFIPIKRFRDAFGKRGFAIWEK